METTSSVHALKQAALALERALIELDYAQQRLKTDRMIPRLDTIDEAKYAKRECVRALKEMAP